MHIGEFLGWLMECYFMFENVVLAEIAYDLPSFRPEVNLTPALRAPCQYFCSVYHEVSERLFSFMLLQVLFQLLSAILPVQGVPYGYCPMT